jgi:hypothetical protein
MPTSTYVSLATYTVTGSPDAEVVFSSIPATYRDLILISDCTHASGSAIDIDLRFNSDTGSNYSRVIMFGDGSGTGSNSATETMLDVGFTNNNKTAMVIQIMDYSATDKHKPVLARQSTAAFLVMATAWRWANTSAITTVSFFPNGSSWAVGSTFSLFGIAS